MKKCLLLLFFVPLFSFSQGSLVLIGGGGESNGGWSNAPYTWALDQSQNRKVAVIYYSSSTSWIPEYFMDLGASDTARFDIDNLTLANAQATYDSLMNYDVFFIKGGNQWDYYSTWKNTKVEDAITDKFNQGGVIMGTSAGMAILSDVIFSAENGSIYPDFALSQNTPNYDIKMVLEDDFLDFFPDYIFDSHFIERGRIGRLISFLDNWCWSAVNGYCVDGIGVDDRTALCIDSNKIGEIMGSASVAIIELNSTFYAFAKDAKYTQLLNGNKFNFNTKQIINGPNAINIDPTPIPNFILYTNYTNTLLLSGSDSISDMNNFMSRLQSFGNTQDSTYIYTSDISKANQLMIQMNLLGFSNIKVVDISLGNFHPTSYFTTPLRILFYGNDWNILKDFLNNTTNGNILKTKLKDNTTVTAFAGQDSKFVGTTFCSNIHDNVYGSYYGELEFKKGLNLIKSSIFMPNTYDENTSSYYENTASAVPWAMVNDTLENGFYLNGKGYLEIIQNGSKKSVFPRGKSSILLINNGTQADTTNSYVYSSQNFLRQITGFKDFKITSIHPDINNQCCPLVEWGSVTNPNLIIEQTIEKGKLLNITNILGEKTQEQSNTPLFYEYENGEVDKKIIID